MTWGAKWRVLAWENGRQQAIELKNAGIFDELVVDHWFHMEQMDDNSWWIGIYGDKRWRIWITLQDDGKHRISIDED